MKWGYGMGLEVRALRGVCSGGWRRDEGGNGVWSGVGYGVGHEVGSGVEKKWGWAGRLRGGRRGEQCAGNGGEMM